jgi:hypothetical protein
VARLPKGSVTSFVDVESGFPEITESGTYLMEGGVEVDKNGVEHHTQLVATKKVYPTSDGEWDTEPQDGSE